REIVATRVARFIEQLVSAVRSVVADRRAADEGARLDGKLGQCAREHGGSIHTTVADAPHPVRGPALRDRLAREVDDEVRLRHRDGLRLLDSPGLRVPEDVGRSRVWAPCQANDAMTIRLEYARELRPDETGRARDEVGRHASSMAVTRPALYCGEMLREYRMARAMISTTSGRL